MDWLMGPDWYVDETKPYMRDVSESERVRLNLRRNKLRGNQFTGVIADCEVALQYLPVDNREVYKIDLENLRDDVILAIENGPTNRQLVKRAEALMTEIKGYLEATLP